MMRILGLVILLFSLHANAVLQRFDAIKVGDKSAAQASSIVEINSTTKGLIIPKMTTTQMNAISAPVDGLLVYNTTLKTVMEYNSTLSAWTFLVASSGGAALSSSIAVVTDSSGNLTSSSTTSTEVGYLHGVTVHTGGIVYTGASNLLTLANGTSGQILSSNGAGAPAWIAPPTSMNLNGQTQAAQVFSNDTNVTMTSSNGTHALGWAGTLSLGRGGTGTNLTSAVGGIVYGSSTSVLGMTAAGTAGQILLSGGAGAPTFSAPLFTPGTNNLVLGPGNMSALTTGNQDTIFGYSVQAPAITSGSNDLFFGYAAGYRVTSGSGNTLVGQNAGSNILTTADSTCVGNNSCSAGTGAQNTWIGSTTGNQSSGAGANNAGLGYGAGNANTSGARNVMLGQQTGNSNSTSSDNVYVGYQAGQTESTGSSAVGKNIIIGSTADVAAATTTNAIAIGYGASAASNNTVIGNSSITNAKIYGTLDVTGLNTSGTIIYSDGTNLVGLGVGTTGQVLQSNGGSAPTWINAGAASLNYYSGFMPNASSWNTTSTSFVDGTNAGGNTLTQRYGSGITVTAAASSKAGITWTPSSSSAVYKITATFGMANSSGAMSAQLTDGTTTISTGSQTLNANGSPQTSLIGIYAPGTASAVTVKIQIAASAGTTTLAPAGSLAASIEWSLVQIK